MYYISTSIGQIDYSYPLHDKVKEDERWSEIVKKNLNLKCRDCRKKTRPAHDYIKIINFYTILTK